ncbi:MAG: hypothetical protein WA364_14055 [Candidatus Nitrosopolaris sp.]
MEIPQEISDSDDVLEVAGNYIGNITARGRLYYESSPHFVFLKHHTEQYREAFTTDWKCQKQQTTFKARLLIINLCEHVD